MTEGRAWIPGRPLGQSELVAIDWSVRTSSTLSALGCLFILFRSYFRPKHERDVSTMLVAALAGIELVSSMVKLPALQFVDLVFDSSDHDYKISPNQTRSKETMCQVQGYLLDVLSLHAVLWNGCMAFNLLRWVVYRDAEEKLESRFWIYFFATSFFCVLWGVTGAIPMWRDDDGPRGTLFGFSRYFCWMRFPNSILYRYIPFVALTLVFIVAVVVHVRRVVLNRARRFSMSPASEGLVSSIQRRLCLYVCVFVCLYTPAIIYRILEAAVESSDKDTWHDHGSNKGQGNRSWHRNSTAASGNITFADGSRQGHDHDHDHAHATGLQVFGIIAQVLINLQGFIIAVLSHQKESPPRKNSIAMSSLENTPSVFLEEMHSSRSGLSRTNSGVKESVSIFASTFNMAEGGVPDADALHKWIPAGHDVYVIGVQECLNVLAMRQAIATHLQVIHGKMFVEYGREIGRRETKLGFHGHIAVTVYVAVDEVQEGHFHMHLEAISKVHRGVNLIGLGRASNKGAVGFAFRFLNTTFAVVNCHLASDPSTKKSKLKKRHQDGSNILSGMSLQSIDNEFDCHLMAHHTIFMGDLNYRLSARDASAEKILRIIATAVNSNVEIRSSRQTTQATSEPTKPWLDAMILQPTDHETLCLESDGLYVLTNSPQALPRQPLGPIVATDPVLGSDVMPSPFSTSSTPSAEEMTWMTLLEHDELKRSMADGVVFHEFDEARISFAPTYRRVLGKAMDMTNELTLAQVSQLYTTVLGDGKVRIPSYTDRILFHSLPGLRVRRRLSAAVDRMTCLQYWSTECIGMSDHKPVSSVFRVVVDKPLSPLKAAAAASPHHHVPLCASPRSLRAQLPVNLFTVQFSKLNVQWGPSLETYMSESDEDSINSTHMLVSKDEPFDSIASDVSRATTASASPTKVDLALEVLRVRSVFPLPCEDEFAEERRLVELADHLLFTSNARGKLKPTWKLSVWRVLAQNGLKQTVVLPKDCSRRQLHVALSFVLPSGDSAGQCVISLADASRRPGRKVDFAVALTVGGRRTGELTGKLTFAVDKTP
ncbi:unnamed protein product [Aphanomyces euteiches]